MKSKREDTTMPMAGTICRWGLFCCIYKHGSLIRHRNKTRNFERWLQQPNFPSVQKGIVESAVKPGHSLCPFSYLKLSKRVWACGCWVWLSTESLSESSSKSSSSILRHASMWGTFTNYASHAYLYYALMY